MTQLIYHPAFDPYNALLRFVRLLLVFKDADWVGLRILDFYLLFPERILKMRLTPSLRSSAKEFQHEMRFPYDGLPESRILFERMQSIQDSALETLLSKGMALDVAGMIELQSDNVPPAILDIARERNENEGKLVRLLTRLRTELAVHGANGLKDRSQLAEYRYDVL